MERSLASSLDDIQVETMIFPQNILMRLCSVCPLDSIWDTGQSRELMESTPGSSISSIADQMLTYEVWSESLVDSDAPVKTRWTAPLAPRGSIKE